MTKTNTKLVEKYEKAAKKVADLYAELPEVVAVVIGGSLARRFTDTVSDIEMYVYYEGDIPSEEEIGKILNRLNAKLTRSKNLHWYHPAWGHHTFFESDGIKFELGYRDIHEIFCRMKSFKKELILPNHGIHDTPFGHYESGVASCIIECKPLIDKKKQIKQLKSYLGDYHNSKIRKETFEYYLNDAKTITTVKTHHAVFRNDTYNFDACMARTIRSLVICLFALNDTYYPGDKWNKRYLDKFKIRPKDFDKRMNEIFAMGELEKEQKEEKYAKILGLINETEKLFQTQNKRK